MNDAMSGARIKTLRQRLGLSQVELAAILGISNVTVNRWENDRALPQASTIERLLRMERDGIEALRDPASARQDNLPLAFASLIGRAADLDAVVALTEARPLTTITGAAGTGKTRLAVESGRVVRQRWSDGVWLLIQVLAFIPS